ncbi:MAG: hypothetical protein PHZ19_04250 [Candidatus Thermoplasmatota archaeon]|nr:hypothetical protein [Candidatus Thermoplasmatota archaeon]
MIIPALVINLNSRYIPIIVNPRPGIKNGSIPSRNREGDDKIADRKLKSPSEMMLTKSSKNDIQAPITIIIRANILNPHNRRVDFMRILSNLNKSTNNPDISATINPIKIM